MRQYCTVMSLLGSQVKVALKSVYGWFYSIFRTSISQTQTSHMTISVKYCAILYSIKDVVKI